MTSISLIEEMNRGKLATAAAVQAAAMAVVAGFIATAGSYCTVDGRSSRRARSRRFSIRQSQFATADADEIYHDGWFRDQFRCTKQSFDRICDMISEEWSAINYPIGFNSAFFLRDRVAVALYYLMHAGSVVNAAKTFGMSKASAVRCIWQVINVITQRLGPRFICMPDSAVKWQRIADGFEDICHFPNCCFAIDGCLFEIERPNDYEGWYCRKSYPAINAQVVVDHKTLILSFDLRPGSANDKSVYNYSGFGDIISRILPPGKYGLADAGYALSDRLLTPFPIEERMPADESLYNYLHSCTRITIERTFGSIKNRFRIFKSPLNQKADEESEQSQTQRMGAVIHACFVLHNILIHLADAINTELESVTERNLEEQPNANEVEVNRDGKVVRDQVKKYLFTNRKFLQQ